MYVSLSVCFHTDSRALKAILTKFGACYDYFSTRNTIDVYAPLPLKLFGVGRVNI